MQNSSSAFKMEVPADGGGGGGANPPPAKRWDTQNQFLHVMAKLFAAIGAAHPDDRVGKIREQKLFATLLLHDLERGAFSETGFHALIGYMRMPQQLLTREEREGFIRDFGDSSAAVKHCLERMEEIMLAILQNEQHR